MLSEYQLHSKYLAVMDLKYALRFSRSQDIYNEVRSVVSPS